MLTISYRQFRRCLIILTLTAFALGGGGQMTLCLTPDGDVHLEPSLFACALSDGCSAAEETVVLANGHVESQGHCLDLALSGDASHHQHRHGAGLLVPALVPLGPPVILPQAAALPVLTPLTVIPPQLVSLKSVVLLI